MPVARSLPAGLIFAALAACGPSDKLPAGFPKDWKAPGWHYAAGPEFANIVFRARSGEDSFYGMCADSPVFVVRLRDDPPKGSDFVLTVDARQWRVPVHRGEHGAAMIVDAPPLVDRLASARGSIRFSGVREAGLALPPSPLVARMVRDCRALVARRRITPA